jgi:hypothetical protein
MTEVAARVSAEVNAVPRQRFNAIEPFNVTASF